MIVIERKSVYDKYNNSPDADFMRHCEDVDHNRPATWAKYPETMEGANDIIAMEYAELMQAVKGKTLDTSEYETNLYHLSVALLHAWRIYERDNTTSNK